MAGGGRAGRAAPTPTTSEPSGSCTCALRQNRILGSFCILRRIVGRSRWRCAFAVRPQGDATPSTVSTVPSHSRFNSRPIQILPMPKKTARAERPPTDHITDRAPEACVKKPQSDTCQISVSQLSASGGAPSGPLSGTDIAACACGSELAVRKACVCLSRQRVRLVCSRWCVQRRGQASGRRITGRISANSCAIIWSAISRPMLPDSEGRRCDVKRARRS
jgi:hypothetical protein